MNPDVPSLEACRRLLWEPDDVEDVCHWWWLYAPCGWVLWWGVWSSDEYRNSYSDRVYAPTIGEMGEEIRRRGWGFKLIDVGGALTPVAEILLNRVIYSAHGEKPADALALALAEALEKESTK